MAEANRTTQMSVSYDKNTDTFYLYLGDEVRGSIARDIGKGILVQLDPKSKQMIGVIVHDFEARFSSTNGERATLPLPIPRNLALA